MHRSTLFMTAISMAALFTWVFCEYAIEARRILKARSLERQQRLARTTEYHAGSVTPATAEPPVPVADWTAKHHVAGHTG